MQPPDPAGSAPTLSLGDIAQLANVERQVVSMWRKRLRSRGHEVPFPTAVTVVNGTERFAVDDVVAYLASTGRGKNPEAGLDALTIAAPLAADRDDAVVLLCLAVLTGGDLAGLAPEELRELAEQADPEDDFLLREVVQQPWPTGLSAHVDEVRAGSFGQRDALARVEAGPLARRRGDRVGSRLLTALISALVETCASHLVAEGHGGALLDLDDEQFLGDAEVSALGDLLIAGDLPAGRRLWRHALLSGWNVVREAAGTPVVRVRSVLGGTPVEALTQIDDVALSLQEDDVAVVVGAAAVLTDPLSGQDEKLRAALLRPGQLVCALRLPRGWSREAHRQSLAVWVLTGRRGADADAARLADLDGVGLALTDLSADVAAALSHDPTRHHRYLRHRPLATVLAGRALVPRGTRALRLDVSSATSLLDTVRGGFARLAEPLPDVVVPVTSAESRVVLRSWSLAELHESGALSLHRGVRVDHAWHDARGSVEVWTAEGASGLRLDPFNVDHHYSRAVRTEPGDVVFEQKPVLRAVVDTVGGALVASPARVLRLTRRVAVGPHLLADRINRAGPGAEWQTVEVPDLTVAASRALDTALALAAAVRGDLLARASALDDSAAALVSGVAAGVLSLTDDPNTTTQDR